MLSGWTRWIWFSILSPELLRRASFASINDLKAKVLAFVAYFNQTMQSLQMDQYRGRALALKLGLFKPRCTSRLVEYDEVYISIIFSKSADTARRLAKQFPNSVVHLDGRRGWPCNGNCLLNRVFEADNSILPWHIFWDKAHKLWIFCAWMYTEMPFCIVPTKEGRFILSETCTAYGTRKKVIRM